MAREILTYFVRNPYAADSLEGVARWRLMDEMIHRTLRETASALEWLTAEGYLTASISPGRIRTFSLNSARAEDVEQFLAESSRQAASPTEAEIHERRRRPRTRQSGKPRTLR
jgi:hypothetical protein